MKPDPLTPPDCDLRNYPWMPLDVGWLHDSHLAVVASGDSFRAAMLLYCASWHQVPAASLPTDDRLLANLAGYGRDMEGWLAVKNDALDGFIECSDSRLYHPIIAEKALESYDQRKKQKERTQKATEARRGVRRNVERGGNRDVDRNDSRDDRTSSDRHDARNEVQRTGQDRTGKEQITTLSSSSSRASAQDDDDSTKAGNGIAKEESFNPLGTTLPEDWTPGDADIAAAAGYGMDDKAIRAELLTFHAYNAQNGTFSKKWSSTWQMWCARWKEREATKPKPRVEVNTTASTPTPENWDRAAALWAKGSSAWPRKSLGPEPGQVGCRCPNIFLTKHNIDPETGRVVAPSKEAVAS